MKKVIFAAIGLLLLVSSSNSQNNCQDFETSPINNSSVSSTGNWVMYNSGSSASSPTKIKIQNNAANGTKVITAADTGGATFLINTSDYNGNWVKNGATCFCFDLKLISDGGTYSPPLQVRHGIYIFQNLVRSNPLNLTVNSTSTNPTIGFGFRLNNTYDENTPWQNICLPIHTIQAGDPLPSNSYGEWKKYGNALGGLSETAAWNNIIQNVTDIGFFVDATGNNQSEIIGLDNLCLQPCPSVEPDPVFDPCCPPLSKESMIDLFVHTPMGNITDPYRIEFVPTQNFKNLMQAYTDLLKLTCGASELHFSWNLDEISGFNGSWIKNIEKEYFHFVANGNGVIQNNPSFFNDPGKECNPGTYYRINVGVYPNDKLECFEAGKCSADLSFEYYVQVNKSRTAKLIINGMPHKTIKMKKRQKVRGNKNLNRRN